MSFGFSHLVVNGCSFTYCQGLDNPLEEGWPKLLADKLNIPLINIAENGCGNGRIARTTIDFLYENPLPNPLYVVAFSQSLRRDEYYKNGNSYRQLHVVGKPKVLLTSYEKAYLDNFDILESIKVKARHWIGLINTFKANNIKYLVTDFIPNSNDDINQLKITHKNMWEAIESDTNRIENLCNLTIGMPKLPCGHDDYPTMPVLANHVYEEIRKRWQ
jgi:hypothetical protein